jgi:large subunit ribosomal protein L13
VDVEMFVARLAAARIGATYNFYRHGLGAALRRERLRAYLAEHADAPFLLVGEAAGYRGARVSGIPFTSERQLTGRGPAEATATILRRTLVELGLDALCWNVVPTHPGTESSNRRPSRAEIEASRPFLEEVAAGREVLAVGRLAAAVTGAPYVRHPSHGGAAEFRAGLLRFAAGGCPELRLLYAMATKTYNAKPGEVARDWYVVDAEGQTLGRLATRIADTLRGKGKPAYTPHVDTGDFVVVVNADKIHVTGNKLDQKRYYRHSGYPGGLRSRTLREELERRPEEVLRRAVKGMLPRNRLARQQITKLKIYAGPEHPHGPQAPKPLTWEDA